MQVEGKNVAWITKLVQYSAVAYRSNAGLVCQGFRAPAWADGRKDCDRG
jgi:hypothetical protein